MEDDKLKRALENLARQSQYPYPAKAYLFTLDAVKNCLQQSDKSAREQLSAKDVAMAFAALAQERFGPCAGEVLAVWNMQTTSDIGKVVFELVRARLLVQGENDTLEAFDHLFDFDKVFRTPYDSAPPYPDTPLLR